MPGCARKANPLKDALPVQVQREWRLHDTEAQPNENASEVVRNLGLRQWLIANYHANGVVRVRLFEMTSEAGAFEARQKWKLSDGIAVTKGQHLAIVDSGSLIGQELIGFAQDLETNMK
jgi:hypothetical protein